MSSGSFTARSSQEGGLRCVDASLENDLAVQHNSRHQPDSVSAGFGTEFAFMAASLDHFASAVCDRLFDESERLAAEKEAIRVAAVAAKQRINFVGVIFIRGA